MSSTEVVLSPTKKSKQQNMEQQQIVSSSVTNGCNNTTSNSDESVNEQTLINNQNETNKDCHADTCMEPLLIHDCVDTNPINDTNCANSDISNDESQNNSDGGTTDTIDSGGGFMKTNLSLNLNSETILSMDEKNNLPKNKKFLESDDQIMNQIFFQTITVTPTTDDDVLANKFLSSDNTPLTPTCDIDPDLIVGSVDFFNRKIDEDEAFDTTTATTTTFTDTADNYQDNDANLCSLNDNFNENYCSFSSIDYNVPQNESNNINNDSNKVNVDDQLSPENELLQPDAFLGEYAETMRQQRPSIVIDCYDSDSKTEEDDNVVIGDEKINDYCFYFDQTIEEDDDDACYNMNELNDNLEDNTDVDEINVKEIETTEERDLENDAVMAPLGKTLHEQQQGEEDEIDECFETEEDDELFNDNRDGEEDEESEGDSSNDDDKSDDEGVINESCLSVNVSGCFNTLYFAKCSLRQSGSLRQFVFEILNPSFSHSALVSLDS
jgi:hypothetical protein